MRKPLYNPIVLMAVAVLAPGARSQEKFVQLAGAPCVAPPVLHCPDKDCPSDRVFNEGLVVEMKTRRTYFLDYPCDLKPGEKVTFILSLHGGGSYGNWQRHYFPIVDYKDKYRLVIATPNSPTRVWSEADDEYLQNIVNSVIGQIGKENIKAFWLVGHSQGGLTSNRLVRTALFNDKGLLETSDWAAKYSCGPRSKPEEIVDTKPGYVYDSTRQNPPNPSWGLLPAPGKAEVYVFPDCKDGRVVADVVRLDKGHTEGLEPNVSEKLVQLMLAAKRGKLQQAQ